MRTDERSNESIARIGELVRKTESLLDPAARAVAIDLVQAVMDLHASALERILELAARESPSGNLTGAMSSDDLVSGILVLHGLHPDDLETRVRRTLQKLRVYFDSRGAGIELIGFKGEALQLRFVGSRPGAGTAAKQLIEDAIYEAAPEIATLTIEGIEERQDAGFVPLSALAPVHNL